MTLQRNGSTIQTCEWLFYTCRLKVWSAEMHRTQQANWNEMIVSWENVCNVFTIRCKNEISSDSLKTKKKTT